MTAPATSSAPVFGDAKVGRSTGPIISAGLYAVGSGDLLSKIRKKSCVNADAWKAMFEANRDKISHPDPIQPGRALRIRPKQETQSRSDP